MADKDKLWSGPVCSMCYGSGRYPYTIEDKYGMMRKRMGVCVACNGHGREPA